MSVSDIDAGKIEIPSCQMQDGHEKVDKQLSQPSIERKKIFVPHWEHHLFPQL